MDGGATLNGHSTRVNVREDAVKLDREIRLESQDRVYWNVGGADHGCANEGSNKYGKLAQ